MGIGEQNMSPRWYEAKLAGSRHAFNPAPSLCHRLVAIISLQHFIYLVITAAIGINGESCYTQLQQFQTTLMVKVSGCLVTTRTKGSELSRTF